MGGLLERDADALCPGGLRRARLLRSLILVWSCLVTIVALLLS